MRQPPRCDVKMLECFVNGTHDSSKGNLVTGLPASTTFQIHCQVIGKSKHSLSAPLQGLPLPQSNGLMRGGHPGLRVMATNVAAVGASTQEAPQTKNGEHAAHGSLTATVGDNGCTLLGELLGSGIRLSSILQKREQCGVS